MNSSYTIADQFKCLDGLTVSDSYLDIQARPWSTSRLLDLLKCQRLPSSEQYQLQNFREIITLLRTGYFSVQPAKWKWFVIITEENELLFTRVASNRIKILSSTELSKTHLQPILTTLKKCLNGLQCTGTYCQGGVELS